jgi:hypothetical protein
MTTTITFQIDRAEALESPIHITEGENRTFACTYWGVPSTVSWAAYYAGSETGNGIACSVVATGSATVSGYTATLPIAGVYNATPASDRQFYGKRAYIINVTATVNSEVFVKYFRIRVRKDESMA